MTDITTLQKRTQILNRMGIAATPFNGKCDDPNNRQLVAVERMFAVKRIREAKPFNDAWEAYIQLGGRIIAWLKARVKR